MPDLLSFAVFHLGARHADRQPTPLLGDDLSFLKSLKEGFRATQLRASSQSTANFSPSIGEWAGTFSESIAAKTSSRDTVANVVA